ncbi:glycosyltransferase [Roseivivax sp. CAU 1761]
MGGIARLGYLVPEFPNQTHAFFWREIAALRAAGVTVTPISTRRPAPQDCPHDFAGAARAETRYLFPPRAGAAARLLAARPRAFAAALAYVRDLPESGAAGRARVAALIPSAAELCRVAEACRLDHLHIHSCANSAHLGALARLLGGPSYSVTVHGNLPVYGRDHAAKFRHAALVTAVTRPLAREVAAVAPSRPVPVITMGVETGRFAAERPEPRPEEPLRFLSVARLNPVKGHALFLAALRRLRDAGQAAHYTIVGAGPAEAEIRAEIARLGLDDAVEMTGPLGEAAVRAELARADVFVLTSFGQGEAAPVAVMEAMAAGLPVICSRIGGTEDMIADGVDGLLVPQRNIAAIAAAAARLAADGALRRRLGAAARLRARRYFDTRATARALLAALEAAAG